MLEYIQKFLDGTSHTLYVDVYDDRSFTVYGNSLKVGKTLDSGKVATYSPVNRGLILDISEWMKSLQS